MDKADEREQLARTINNDKEILENKLKMNNSILNMKKWMIYSKGLKI
jgi:hypothetical protein